MSAKISPFQQAGTEFLQWQKWTQSWQKIWLGLSEECYDFALKISLKAASTPLLALALMSDSETSSEAPSV